ncbi:glycosyltransferase [Aureibaculum algae]|uniref:Glycosyltransferase n=1 Tax=Aureibaculum algae TaxID=2584122 RepID=A0A5B7TWT5_9FLAO|nr:glycosyltransferase [Aureibaculum algae]QCX39142.1 glycosyltransferase [Aureibaculum algae]
MVQFTPVKKRISIVIPMYNAENYIEQCLASILYQPLIKNDYEVIIINDGSKDGSLIKATEISKEHENITVFTQENKGVSAARNKGIDLANGKYIWFIDADDYIISDTANHLLTFAEKHDLDILQFNKIRTESRALNKAATKHIDISKIEIFNGKEYASKVDLNDSCCTNLYKKEFVMSTKIRFIEGKVMEDMTFNAELFPLAEKITHFPIDTYRYVINPNSIWTSKESKAFRKSIVDFIFMAKKFSDIIEDYKINNIGTDIINLKQQEMLFNVSKRLLTSDFKIIEINAIINDLSRNNLYPLTPYKGKYFLKKLELFLFNRKLLFITAALMYRLLKRPIDYFIIRRHQRNREKLIKKTIVKFD